MNKISKETAEAALNVINLKGTSLTIASITNNAVDGNIAGTIIGTVSVVETFVSLVKKIPALGAVVVGTTFAFNLSKVKEEFEGEGITNETLYNLLSDIAIIGAAATTGLFGGGPDRGCSISYRCCRCNCCGGICNCSYRGGFW